jgi:hypothetical protein
MNLEIDKPFFCVTERFKKFIPFVLQAECVFRKGYYGDYS